MSLLPEGDLVLLLVTTGVACLTLTGTIVTVIVLWGQADIWSTFHEMDVDILMGYVKID